MKNKLNKQVPYKYLFVIGLVLIILSNLIKDELIAGFLDIAGLLFFLDAVVVGFTKSFKWILKRN